MGWRIARKRNGSRWGWDGRGQGKGIVESLNCYILALGGQLRGELARIFSLGVDDRCEVSDNR